MATESVVLLMIVSSASLFSAALLYIASRYAEHRVARDWALRLSGAAAFALVTWFVSLASVVLPQI